MRVPAVALPPKPLTDAELLSGLRHNPVGVEIADAEHSRVAAERQALVDQLAVLDKKAEHDFPKLRTAAEAAGKACTVAQTALQEAQTRHRQAAAAVGGASAELARERQALELQLRESRYDGLIDAFVREMWDEDANTRKLPIDTVSAERGLDARTLKPRVIGANNINSMMARCTAIRAAVDEAESYRLLPDQSDVAERLDRLRASLPAVGPAALPPEPLRALL